MDKVRIGIIGCGGIANGKHMPSLKTVPNVRMVAFCDIIPERAEKAAKQYGVEGAKVYTDYNKIQKKQGFDLEKHKGKTATIYTYNITNYKENKNVIADLIVQDGVLIGADLCDTNVETGFLVALNENGQN